MKRRTTVYVEEKLYNMFVLYKQQTEETITFSEFVNKVLHDYLYDPFKWENQHLYNFAMRKEDI